MRGEGGERFILERTAVIDKGGLLSSLALSEPSLKGKIEFVRTVSPLQKFQKCARPGAFFSVLHLVL